MDKLESWLKQVNWNRSHGTGRHNYAQYGQHMIIYIYTDHCLITHMSAVDTKDKLGIFFEVHIYTIMQQESPISTIC